MTSTPAWEDSLQDADNALLQRRVADASASYDGLRVVLERSGTQDTLLPRAALAHRIGVVRLLEGNEEEAERSFSRVADLTHEAERLATSDPRRTYALRLLHQSLDHRAAVGSTLGGGIDLDGVPDPVWRRTVLMVAICEHGCPSITPDCGYSGPHC